MLQVLVGLRGAADEKEDLAIVSEHRARLLIGGSTRLRAEARREYLEYVGEEEMDYDDVFYSDVE